MNIVNANTWATNIGRSPRLEIKTGSTITQQQKATILKGRAKSASLIFGRCRTDSLKQTLCTEEGVKCVHLHQIKKNNEWTERDVKGAQLYPIQDNIGCTEEGIKGVQLHQIQDNYRCKEKGVKSVQLHLIQDNKVCIEEGVKSVQLHQIQNNKEYTEDCVKGMQLHLIQDKKGETTKSDAWACEKNTHFESKLFNFKQRVNFKDMNKGPPVSKQPLTAAPINKVKLCHVSNEPLAFVEDTLKIMSISRRVSVQKHKPSVITIKQDNIEDEHQAALFLNMIFRAKSAPLSACTTSPESYITNTGHFHLPLFWRTRKSYHRNQNLGKQVNEMVRKETKGTQLRSLLQNSRNSNHQQSCPYKCQSCFRACLASDTYMQQQLDKKS